MANSVPSVWPARYEKRQAAHARDMNRLGARLQTMESSMSTLASRIEDIYNVMHTRSHREHFAKDGPSIGDTGALHLRLDRIELLLF